MGSGTASGSFQVFAGTSVAPGAQPIYSVDDLKPNGNYKLQAVSFSESKNRQLVLRATGAGSAGSQNTFTYSAAVDDTQNPYAAASPEYPGHIIVDSNGDGTTMTDEPHFGTYNTLAAQKGFTQVVFQGRTFVLSNGQVLACVDWTRQYNVSQNDWSGTYTGVRVTTFNPPLTKLPQPFPMVLDEYNLPDAVGQSMLDTGESYLPPAPQQQGARPRRPQFRSQVPSKIALQAVEQPPRSQVLRSPLLGIWLFNFPGKSAFVAY